MDLPEKARLRICPLRRFRDTSPIGRGSEILNYSQTSKRRRLKWKKVLDPCYFTLLSNLKLAEKRA